ncbi:ABC transporter substrate-binding protein [Achromobacter spanius]|uniref:ABC transporter substrate-binding protein n=1 Tax=Achromobacter spanius TaxID=217203 RepID=UPI003207F9F4
MTLSDLIRAALAAGALVSSASGAAPIVFNDMSGNAVNLPAPTQRAVTLPMPAGSLLISLDGGAQHLAGMHPSAYGLIKDGLLARMFPATAAVRTDVTRSGFVPNVETLLQMEPDLVWQWGHMGDDLIAPLRNAGLPTAALVYGTEARTREWIRLMGLSLGQEARAQAQLRWRDEVRAGIRAVTDGIAPANRPGVLYLSRYEPQLRAAGGNTSFDDDIALAGGRNVSASIASGQTVNIEQIMAWAPEVILLNNFEPGLTPQTLYRDPLFADIPAVRDRRVYKLPLGGYLWDPPSQESPLYWQWLSLLLHPDKFAWPLRENIFKAYGELYGHQPAADEIDAVLRMKVNEGAAGYERFR